MMRLLRHQVFQASALRGIALAVGVGSSVIVSRLGGADVKGVTSAFAASTILCFTAVNLDLGQQVLREARATHNLNQIRRMLRALWPWYGALAVVVGSAGLAAGHTATVWLAAGTFAYLISAHMGVAANGLSGPASTALGGILQQLGLGIAAMGLLLTGGLCVADAPLIVIISFLAPLPLYLWAARPRPTTQTNGGPFRSKRHLIRAGLKWQIARFAQLLLLRLDTLIVFAFLSAGAAGVYSVGLATSSLAGIVPAQFAANATYETTQGKTGTMRSNIKMAVLTGTVGSVVLAAVGHPLLTAAYGKPFEGSYPVLLATLPGVVAYSVVQVFTNQMRLVAGPRSVTIPSALGLAVMMLSLAILIPTMGTVGAGIASSIGACTAAAVIYLMWRRRRSR